MRRQRREWLLLAILTAALLPVTCGTFFSAAWAARLGWDMAGRIDLCAWGLADCGPTYRARMNDHQPADN